MVPQELTDVAAEALRADVESHTGSPARTTPRQRKVATIALTAVPDGWAKVDGEWVRLRPGVKTRMNIDDHPRDAVVYEREGSS